MSHEAGLCLFLASIVLGAFVLPAEQLPHKASVSVRLLLGCLLLILGGAGLGRGLIA